MSQFHVRVELRASVEVRSVELRSSSFELLRSSFVLRAVTTRVVTHSYDLASRDLTREPGFS